MHIPKSIKRENNYLNIQWADGHASQLELAYLRRKCPCVSCKGDTQRTPDGGIELPSFDSKPVEIVASAPVGNYALNFRFNDGHDTGIYSYEHLRKICPCPECQTPALKGSQSGL